MLVRMNLSSYLEQQIGLAARLARTLGVSAVVVSNWANCKRPVPLARCPAIERATGGAVTCEELRPDVDWAVLRGTAPVPLAPAGIAAVVMQEGEPADPDARRIVPVESA